ncbi:MAG TPA: DNA polymerase III subunit gamma/tau [Gammaproteobacteria bacterium]|nr:DNA polymerase III subunit gamma/tau [Gammaproteobacteria bacterium]
MSYQVLARKWRPRTFQEMVGQSHVLQALVNALDNDRLHHAYLFTGTRGVGKTTLARILAKCLNCEKGVSSTPCGECSACVSIDESRFVDLIEVDAASRARVEETRDLMDNVQYAPSAGRYKVYLIDEVHMFSNHSFNALLKTLEEPPPHVKFLLATTEAKRIPVTILSRCLQFNLKLITVDQIEQQLARILEQEGIESDPAARELIARAADGSMRDALSLLDQAISHGGGRLEEEAVRGMLGTVDTLHLDTLLQALIKGDSRAVLDCVEEMAGHSPDYDSVLVELLSVLQRLAVIHALGIDNSDEPEALKELSQRISEEDIQLYYQMALMGRRDLALAPDPRSGFEMILVRMLAFRPARTVIESEVTLSRDEPAVPSAETTPGTSGENENTTKHTDTINEAGDWQDIIDEMALAGLVRELAGHCVLKEHTRDRIQLALAPAQEHLLNPTQKDRLQKALKTRFGEDVRIVISVEDPSAETPVQRREREERERQKAAEASVENDPNVRALQDLFDATVDKDSIRPDSSTQTFNEDQNV